MEATLIGVTIIVILVAIPIGATFALRAVARYSFPHRPVLSRLSIIGPVVGASWVLALGVVSTQFLRMGTMSAPPAPASAPPQSDPMSAIPSFPWPPPVASAFVSIPLRRLVGQDPVTGTPYRVGDVDSGLRRALLDAGHVEWSYYKVPQGFAVATRMESIATDGSPRPGEARWSTQDRAMEEFSMGAYLKALFAAPAGRYRVIVFVVTPAPFAPQQQQVTGGEATRWVSLGGNRLPLGVLERPIEAGTECRAMIYEFHKDAAAEARFMSPGTLIGSVHLVKTGLRRFVQ